MMQQVSSTTLQLNQLMCTIGSHNILPENPEFQNESLAISVAHP